MATEGEGDRYRSSFIRKKMQGFKEVSLRGVITVCAEEQVDKKKKIDMERNEAGFVPSLCLSWNNRGLKLRKILQMTKTVCTKTEISICILLL